MYQFVQPHLDRFSIEHLDMLTGLYVRYQHEQESLFCELIRYFPLKSEKHGGNLGSDPHIR